MDVQVKSRHPEAMTVATLVWSGRNQPGLEESVAEGIALYFEGWPDEQKADLYALMAEKLTEDQPYDVFVGVVSDCLWDNLNHWARRMH